ncbi:MAG: FAD binding domain-containing protein [Treponemataceae bacterium]|nr:FAD binding domain-containing protein [Treponemataceae bacterium]
MPINKSSVYFANNSNDVQFHLKTISNLEVFGGCTTVKTFPPAALIIGNLAEYKGIVRHERFIEFGAAVTLGDILALQKKRLPAVFYQAALSVANPFIRNAATIGGNICGQHPSGVRHTLYGPLLALDAMIELRSSASTSTIPLSKFTGVPKGYFLSRVRVPIEDWDIEEQVRLGPPHELTEESGTYTFLANTQKGILFDVRIAFCSSIVLRSRELENNIVGKRLPLSENDIEKMTDTAMAVFDSIQEIHDHNIQPVLRAQFESLLKHSLSQLS